MRAERTPIGTASHSPLGDFTVSLPQSGIV
jgi:hypothetical protein